MSVHVIKDKAEFTSFLSSNQGKLVVVDFHATWCGPCKMIAPEVELLAKEFTDILFLKVDVDENDDLSTEYNITAMPTFVFLKNSIKLDEMKGASASKLKEMIMKHK